MTSLTKTAALPAKFALRRFVWPLTALQVARAARTQWNANLSRRQKKQLLALLRASRGRPFKHLTRRQRSQLWSLVRSYGPGEFTRNSAAIALPFPGAGRLRKR